MRGTQIVQQVADAIVGVLGELQALLQIGNRSPGIARFELHITETTQHPRLRLTISRLLCDPSHSQQPGACVVHLPGFQLNVGQVLLSLRGLQCGIGASCFRLTVDADAQRVHDDLVEAGAYTHRNGLHHAIQYGDLESLPGNRPLLNETFDLADGVHVDSFGWYGRRQAHKIIARDSHRLGSAR